MRETRKLRKKSHKKTRSFRKMKGRGELDDIPFSTNDFSFIEQNNENRTKKTADMKKYWKNYYQENKDTKKAKNKKYYENHKDQIREYQKGYKDKKKEINRLYRIRNKDKIKQYNKKYYEENKDEINTKDRLSRLEKKRIQEENDVANILLGLSNNNLVSNANINTNKSQGIKRTMKRKLNT